MRLYDERKNQISILSIFEKRYLVSKINEHSSASMRASSNNYKKSLIIQTEIFTLNVQHVSEICLHTQSQKPSR